MRPPRVFVRAIPSSYVSATVAVPEGRIELELARIQHQAYVRGLRALGYQVLTLPTADDLPDSVFVEDTAVLTPEVAFVTRSAHPVRALEHATTESGLRALGDRAVVRCPEGATLDGGDVLRIGRRFLVGQTARTSAPGVEALRQAVAPFGYEVIAVPVPDGVLHLKCVCSAPLEGLVLCVRTAVDPALFAGQTVVWVDEDESYASNTVGLGRRVLVAEGFPGVARDLSRAGAAPLPLDISEIRKGDGALTCLSLVLGRPSPST
jgi:dimethylargininase